MRGLLLNDEVTQRIKAHVAWADLPENWYHPESDKEPPGDNPAYVLMLEMGFRVAYSMTVVKDKRYRQLSVSVDGNRWPHELAAFTIATLFGFTGGVEERGATTKPGNDWQMDLDKPYRAIVFVQEIRRLEETKHETSSV